MKPTNHHHFEVVCPASAPLTRARISFRILAVVGVLCMCCGAWLLARRSDPPTVQLLQRPFKTSVLMRDRLAQLAPVTRSWTWLGRVQDALFGRRRPINLSAELAALPDSIHPLLLSRMPADSCFACTNGLRICFLSAQDLKSLREVLKEGSENPVLTRARVAIADGIGAILYSGQSILLNGATNDLGLTWNVFHAHTANARICFLP